MVVSLNSDEEPQSDVPFQDNSSFDEEEAEYDPSEPYVPMLQTLDLPLGLEVLHVAFPQMPASLQRTSLDSLPALMSHKLVCALACSDSIIRVLTIPLMPPSTQSKARPEVRHSISNLDVGQSIFGEQLVPLMGGTNHRSMLKGVSVSMTASTPGDEEDVDMEDNDENRRRPFASRSASRSRSRSQLGRYESWDLLIASHSSDISGLLLIYRISLNADGISLSPEQQAPWLTQKLASPAVSVDFNSALYPAERHSRLLVAESRGAVRIFDCIPRSRDGQGAWLVSLNTEFETSYDSVTRRKPILDAQWILGGKCLLVLLADGKYGIWDIEKAGPRSVNTVNVPRPLTTFAFDGWIGKSSISRPLTKTSTMENESKSKLAPMTPNTRKKRQEVLFTGPVAVPQHLDPARGGISVCPVQDRSNSRANDESVLLWHGNQVIIIHSLLTHWSNRMRGSENTFGNGAKGEPQPINNLQLGGEMCNEINLFPRPQGPANDSIIRAEILVTGERRLLIITAPLLEPPPPAEASPPPLSSLVDQQLLARGELDVHGMDRILAGMSNGNSPTRNHQNFSYGRRNKLLMSL